MANDSTQRFLSLIVHGAFHGNERPVAQGLGTITSADVRTFRAAMEAQYKGSYDEGMISETRRGLDQFLNAHFTRSGNTWTFKG